MDPLRLGLNLRPTLLAAGVSDRQLRALRRSGELCLLRPGAYASADGGPVQRHRLCAQAAAARMDEPAVFSHVTAAVLHGVTLWDTDLSRVHATRPRRSGGGRRNGVLNLHIATVSPDEIVLVDGLPVTSLPRTLVDLGRMLPFERALVPADAALHRHLVTRAELDDALDRAARRPGNGKARQVLMFAQPGATNPGETFSRLAIHRAGLPAPALQHRIVTPRGTFDVDFWWEEYATAGEFDGKVKYGRLLAPGQDPGDVVFAEKVREDALRAAGCEVARWTWGELDAFGAVTQRILEAFARGRR